MPVKRRATRRSHRRRGGRVMRCDQCGQTGAWFVFRECSRCGAPVHTYCMINHHVDNAGDSNHPPRDYSHLEAA